MTERLEVGVGVGKKNKKKNEGVSSIYVFMCALASVRSAPSD